MFSLLFLQVGYGKQVSIVKRDSLPHIPKPNRVSLIHGELVPINVNDAPTQRLQDIINKALNKITKSLNVVGSLPKVAEDTLTGALAHFALPLTRLFSYVICQSLLPRGMVLFEAICMVQLEAVVKEIGELAKASTGNHVKLSDAVKRIIGGLKHRPVDVASAMICNILVEDYKISLYPYIFCKTLLTTAGSHFSANSTLSISNQVKEYYSEFNKTLGTPAVAVVAPDACKLVMGSGYSKSSASDMACRSFLANVEKQRGKWSDLRKTSTVFVTDWLFDSGVRVLCGSLALKTNINPTACKSIVSISLNELIIPRLHDYIEAEKQLANLGVAKEASIPEDVIRNEDLRLVVEESVPSETPLIWDNKTLSRELPLWLANTTSPDQANSLGHESFLSLLEHAHV